ncbi:MAG TPA: phosphatidate cytidylyltransferase [Bryobacteraceae bacterium]|jgi:phosphatidate cytidylyltransferase|nr:phosphatidate cytidylyltransferase [Bryobacteraceae bacterium]
MIKQSDTLLIFASLIGILAASSVATAIIRRCLGNGKAKPVLDNVTARIKAWWVIVIVAGLPILAGREAVIVLFALVSLAALREFMSVTRTRQKDYGALALSFFVVLPLQYVLIWHGQYGAFTILIPVYSFLIVPIAAVLFADTKDFLARASETQWGLMVCVYCISYVPALFMLEIPGYQNRNALLVAFLLIVSQASDILQFICGKLFGRRHIAPSVSPGKTVEGFVGGVASAIAVGGALWRFTPFTPWEAAAMALGIALSGFGGGLVMSAIKRDRGVKDWGSLIDGHGGMLDRLDSVAFSAPLFFHLTRYFFTP